MSLSKKLSVDKPYRPTENTKCALSQSTNLLHNAKEYILSSLELFGCSVAATIGQLNTVWCCNEKAQKCFTPWGENMRLAIKPLSQAYIFLLFSWIKLDENEVKTNENLVRLLNSGTWEEAAQWWKKRRKNEKRKADRENPQIQQLILSRDLVFLKAS